MRREAMAPGIIQRCDVSRSRTWISLSQHWIEIPRNFKARLGGQQTESHGVAHCNRPLFDFSSRDAGSGQEEKGRRAYFESQV